MDPIGMTRGSFHRDHALIDPASQRWAPLTGWDKTSAACLITPRMGAGASMYLASMAPGAKAGPCRPWVERFVYVLEGEARVEVPDGKTTLRTDSYVFIPPETPHVLAAQCSTRALIFEHDYYPFPGNDEKPQSLANRSRTIEREPVDGDAQRTIQRLLPKRVTFDIAVNLTTIQPGAAPPGPETDAAERCLYVMEGQGVLRVNDRWQTIRAGDAAWIAPHCPWWFAALGDSPLRMISCQNAYRDPLPR